MFVENIKKELFNTCNFCNHNIKNLILLLQKDVSPYKYMDDWEKFNEISLPENKKTVT